MITNVRRWEEFEKRYGKSQRLSLKQKFSILDGLYEEAMAIRKDFGNSSEGLETAIRIAKAINCV